MFTVLRSVFFSVPYKISQILRYTFIKVLAMPSPENRFEFLRLFTLRSAYYPQDRGNSSQKLTHWQDPLSNPTLLRAQTPALLSPPHMEMVVRDVPVGEGVLREGPKAGFPSSFGLAQL